MLQNENIESNNLHNNNIPNDLNFSFGKYNNFNNNSNNNNKKMLQDKEINNNNHNINDKENYNSRKNNGYLIYKLLNKNKESNKDKKYPIFSNINNTNPTNKPTKPKIELINNNCSSPKKQCKKNIYYSNCKNNENKKNLTNVRKIEPLFNFDKVNNIKEKAKEEILKIFNIKNEEILPFEIKYFLDNPKFNYDFQHQNDPNSNYQYINENFIDILLNSFNKKLILNSNINPIKQIQKEVTFQKRNILVSWLTEMNFKYIKDQNVLFTAIKYLDTILYHKNVNIDEFQLIGIICFNLALKMENHHKVFFIDEIISLVGGCGEKDEANKINYTKKIKRMENIICDLLDFDLESSTSVLILQRLIQMLNIQNKKTEEIFLSIAYFFLEISLYEEQFYELDEFAKALSSLLMTKEILTKCFYKIGFHNYLTECSKLRMKEIKYYYTLCTKVIKNLKSYKYGSIIFIKYQHKDFHYVINNYLNSFIIDCIQDKNIVV